MPDARWVFSSPAAFIAFGGGSGLAPRAPGTAGTLAACPLHLLFGWLLAPTLHLAAIGVLFALGIWACAAAGRALGTDDHGGIVIDEVAGQWITLLGLVALPGLPRPHGLSMAIGLLLAFLLVAGATLGTVAVATLLVGPGYFAEAMGHLPGDPMGEAMGEGTYAKIELLRPFIALSKAEIASRGAALGVDFAETWSCYKGGEIHCGVCGTCVERREAFLLAGLADPTVYEQSPALPRRLIVDG